MYRRIFIFAIVTSLSSALASGQGKILWNEATNGELGQTDGTATPLGALVSGTNTILGTAEAVPDQFGWLLYPDFFTFSIPSGLEVTAVKLQVNQQILGWLGTDYGTQIGYRYTSISEELLPFLGGWPLQSGNYAMYMSDEVLQNVPTSVPYRLDFVVAAVPEPSTWALFALGSAGLWSFARRRRK